MGHLVEFETADGGTVLVEVADQGGFPVTRGIERAGVAEHARKTFEESVARIQPAVRGVMAQLRGLEEEPDEIQVAFGLDLHAEAGAFIATASTTANFSVSVTWRRDSSSH